MREEDFSSGKPGRLVSVGGVGKAFVPEPLASEAGLRPPAGPGAFGGRQGPRRAGRARAHPAEPLPAHPALFEARGGPLLQDRGVFTEARDAACRAETLFDLREAYRERFRKEGGSANVLAAVEHLFGWPVTGIRELEHSLNVSFEAARRLVNRLEGEGVLEEITGRRRNRVYAAQEIVRVLQGPSDEE